MTELTNNELLRLDGYCRPEIQSMVDAVKMAPDLPESESRMLGKILDEARKKKKLTFTRTSISYCPCCGRSEGYFPIKRTSGRGEKGNPDYDKPRYFTGYDLSRGFVVVRGCMSIGVCDNCSGRIIPLVASGLGDEEIEIPKAITGIEPKWERVDSKECRACGWTGHEKELLLLPAVFGGYYPGECPSCHAQNTAFGPTNIENKNGYMVIPAGTVMQH